MPRARWSSTVALAALVVSAVAVSAPAPAEATEQATRSTEQSTRSTEQGTGATDRLQLSTVARATTERIHEMAAKGDGQLLTLESGAGIQHDVTCYITVGLPYGGGAPTADVKVDGVVSCDDWVHAVSLRMDLYRDGTSVANNFGSLPYTYGIGVTAGVTGCTSGNYWGVATVVAARYDHTPPVRNATKFGPPRSIGCGSTPPPPPPPTAVTVANPGTQTIYQATSTSLQMTASGGTAPYAWTATGLPNSLSINASTGLISGTPYFTGTYTVTVTATAAAGGSGSATFTWRVIREPCRTC